MLLHNAKAVVAGESVVVFPRVNILGIFKIQGII